MTLEPPQNSVGQSVELHQCIVWALHQREKVSEYRHRPRVCGMDLVLGTETREPNPKESPRVLPLQALSDGCMVSSEQLFNAKVLVGTSLGYSFNRPLLRQKLVFPADVLPMFDMSDHTLHEPQLHPYCT